MCRLIQASKSLFVRKHADRNIRRLQGGANTNTRNTTRISNQGHKSTETANDRKGTVPRKTVYMLRERRSVERNQQPR